MVYKQNRRPARKHGAAATVQRSRPGSGDAGPTHSASGVERQSSWAWAHPDSEERTRRAVASFSRPTPRDVSLRTALVEVLRDYLTGDPPRFEEPAESASPPRPEIEEADLALPPAPAETPTPATLDQFDLPTTPQPQNVEWMDSTDWRYLDRVRNFRRLDLDEFCERLEDGRRSFVVAHHTRWCPEAESPREETPRPRGKTFFANCNGWNCRCPVTFHADADLLQ